MIQTRDKITLSGPARNGWVQHRIQDHLGLLKRRQLTIVAQELRESHVPGAQTWPRSPLHQLGVKPTGFFKVYILVSSSKTVFGFLK